MLQPDVKKWKMVLEYHKHHSNTDLTFEHSVAALIASILTSCSSSHNSSAVAAVGGFARVTSIDQMT